MRLNLLIDNFEEYHPEEKHDSKFKAYDFEDAYLGLSKRVTCAIARNWCYPGDGTTLGEKVAFRGSYSLRDPNPSWD
jgi:hypothetical protein